MAFDERLLSGVRVMVAVVEAGSFTAAARALGLTDSAVSRAIARLESRVGARLFDRTTRFLRLTDEGARFHASVAPMLAGITEAAEALAGTTRAVTGRLRVDVDAHFARAVLAPHLSEFLDRHPELQLELLVREVPDDLVREGLDLAIRFGPPASSSMVTRLLAETRVLTVASPGYLARHGRPAHPAELARYRCIHFNDPRSGRPFEWEFHRDGEILSVAVGGGLTTMDAGTMLAACLAGAGIAQTLAMGVEPLLASGALIELFPDWPDERYPLQALYPSGRHVPAKVRALLDFCQRLLAAHPA
ncbi:LysR family transcriptional regulator [Sphingomonas sp. dw_22]|uniref:LysR family transcriptional regulator n=1 Tax=Sphingomonas sp. dw_22 TaxID=2721175 RepID=UPI001BD4961A|nr:LysR family transcriptional regulator [Sphingomonas sp. dw_22]